MPPTINYYTFDDFMRFSSKTFDFAFAQPFTWSGTRFYRYRTLWLRRVILFLCILNVIYLNIGMLTYLLIPHELCYGSVVSEIAETGSWMCLIFVAICNAIVMYWHGGRISALIGKFQKIFPMRGKAIIQCHPMGAISGTATGAGAGAVGTMGNLRRGVATPYRLAYFFRKSNSLSKIVGFLYLCNFYYNILPIAEYLYEWQMPNLKIKYRYQSNTWYPWQIESLASWLAAYLLQVLGSITAICFTLGPELLLIFFATQLQMHFDYLAGAFETLDAGAAGANDELKYLIDYHAELLSYSNDVNSVFENSLLVNLLTSVVALCLLSFVMLMINWAISLKFAVAVASFVMFIYIICYIGTEISEASQQLLYAAFHGNWYDGNLAYRRTLYFFMMRCHKPVELRAYKFGTVSRSTFTTIIKSSYSLLTFLQAMGK